MGACYLPGIRLDFRTMPAIDSGNGTETNFINFTITVYGASAGSFWNTFHSNPPKFTSPLKIHFHNQIEIMVTQGCENSCV